MPDLEVMLKPAMFVRLPLTLTSADGSLVFEAGTVVIVRIPPEAEVRIENASGVGIICGFNEIVGARFTTDPVDGSR